MRLHTRTPAIIWYGAAGLLACGLALYPIEGVASPGSSQGPAVAAGSTGLDGLAYVRADFSDEYAAISWITKNTRPSDVVVEGYGNDYWGYDLGASSNVISALTGRPTLIGWPGAHEALWQYAFVSDAAGQRAAALISQREHDVDELYSTPDPGTATSLLRQYHVAYVFIGPFERSKYYSNPTSPALAKFQSLLGKPVLRSGRVALYKVPAALRG